MEAGEAATSAALKPKKLEPTSQQRCRRRKTRYSQLKATTTSTSTTPRRELDVNDDEENDDERETASIRSANLRRSPANEDLRTRNRHKKRDTKWGDGRTSSSSSLNNRRVKLNDIERALKAEPVDVTSLRQLAITHGGLVNDDMRCKVWPHLLRVDVYETSPRPVMDDVKSYRDYTQVVLDVNRCLRRFPPDIDEKIRLDMQDQLVYLIVRILMKHPELHYYQGFHDICITFLLAVGEEMAFALVEQLSLEHLKDFMDATMEKTIQALNYLYPIIGRENPQVRLHMEKAGVGTIFCLSWLITWFGHVLNDYRHIVRLYDFFLANDPLMPVYLAAAIVLHRENEILSTDCEMAALHSLLSHVPDDLPFEELISKTGDLFLNYPPSEFKAEVDELNRSGLVRLHETGNNSRKNGRMKYFAHSCSPVLAAKSRLMLVLAPKCLRQQKIDSWRHFGILDEQIAS